MNNQFEVVPNIISGKDLDYLSDMFSWNYGAYKCSFNSIPEIKDNDIKEMITNASQTFYHYMEEILDILNNGGKNE